MPKYIIPFADPTHWETNPNCNLCASLDSLYKEIIASNGTMDSKINYVNEYFVVDGYQLLPVLEKNGAILYRDNDIDRIKQYVNSHEQFMIKVNNVLYPNNQNPVGNPETADIPTVLHSRWCKECGSRKPDIYDPLRNENLALLPINNFNVSYDGTKTSISWRDTGSISWTKTILLKNGVSIAEYTDAKNKYETVPFIDNNVSIGNIYYYQVLNCELSGSALIGTNEFPLYIPDLDNTPPMPITDTSIKQIRYLTANADGTYTNNDSLIINWTNPIDADGISLRMCKSTYVPADEKDGIEVNQEVPIDIAADADTLYYFKPFPYGKQKIRPRTIGIGYENYRSYNRNSKYAYYTVTAPVNNVTKLQITPGDEQLAVRWVDPADTESTQWIKTKVIYKLDSPILNEQDGIEFVTLDQKNLYNNTDLIIPELENGKLYYVGVFPMSSNGVCDVTLINQTNSIPGFYKPAMSFSEFNLFDYMGNWSANDLIFTATEDTIGIFESTINARYGANLSFDLRILNAGKDDKLILYYNDDIAYSSSGNCDWTKVNFDIGASSYSKFLFECLANGNAITISIKNIILYYNSF